MHRSVCCLSVCPSVHQSVCLSAICLLHSSASPLIFTLGVLLKSNILPFSYDLLDSSFESNTSIPCQAPLVNTDLYNEKFPFRCSPKCLEKNWPAPPERVTFTIMLHVTVAVCCICCIITLITWARSPDL